MASSKSKRLEEIVKILVKYRVVQNFTQQKNPEQVRHAFDELGATFIKIGQMLSVRTDLLTPAYIEELKKLQDNVKTDSFTVIQEILENEWKVPIDSLVDSLTEKPLASASIGQVHQGVLKNGQTVIIKVQHPGVAEAVDTDLALFEKALPIISYLPESKVIDLRSVLKEIKQSLDDETNFLKEAQNAQTFYQYNQDWQQVIVPRVYLEYCTKKVLVMDFMTGNSLRKLIEADDQSIAYQTVTNQALKKAIALELVAGFMKQVFEDGFFHADPHPGNLFFRLLSNEENQAELTKRLNTKSGQVGKLDYELQWQTEQLTPYRLIYLDFGMMGQLDQALRKALTDTLVALFTQDERAITTAVLALGKQDGPFDELKFSADLKGFLQQFAQTEIKDIPIETVLIQVIQICRANNLQINDQITMLGKAFGTLEGVLEELAPELSFMEVVQPYAEKYFLQQIDLKTSAKKQGLAILKALRDLPQIPDRLLNVLDTVAAGKSQVNLELKEQDKILKRIESMVNRLVIGIILAAVIVSSSLLVVSNPDNSPDFVDILGIAGYIAVLVVILFFTMRYLYHHLKRKK